MLGCEQVLKRHGYHMGNYIGHGMTSECFEIKPINFHNTQFVCKIIELFPPENKQKIIDKFKEEVDILSLLDHPNIIRCYDFFQDGDYLFIVMEYCSNGSLQKVLYDHYSYNPATYVSYALQLINALIYCREFNIAHLDIKPQNIFLSQYNKIKLADFGCSKVFKYGEMFDHKRGSKFFMAPEVTKGSYNPFAADIYSLGMTLICMRDPSVMKRGMQSDDFWEMMNDECVRFGDLGEILQECIAKDPSKRPNIFELKKEFESLNVSIQQMTLRQSGSTLHLNSMGQVPPRLPLLKPGSGGIKPTLSMRNIMGQCSSLPSLFRR